MLETLKKTLAATINQETDVLIEIDVQSDFLPGGALAVPKGNEIVPVIGAIAPLFKNIVLTQDMHPAGHSSFASSYEGKAPFDTVELPYGTQVLWPDHCVIGTGGVNLQIDVYSGQNAQMLIRKGYRPDVDSYSAFMENDKKTLTGLSGFMRERGLKRAFFAGLATDFCVGFSAIDARTLGFDAFVIEQACRGISPDSIAERKAEMLAAGVEMIA